MYKRMAISAHCNQIPIGIIGPLFVYVMNLKEVRIKHSAFFALQLPKSLNRLRETTNDIIRFGFQRCIGSSGALSRAKLARLSMSNSTASNYFPAKLAWRTMDAGKRTIFSWFRSARPQKCCAKWSVTRWTKFLYEMICPKTPFRAISFRRVFLPIFSFELRCTYSASIHTS